MPGRLLEPQGAQGTRDLLRAWLDAIGFEGSVGDLVALLQEPDFNHAALYRLALRLQADVLAGTYREMFIVLGGITAVAGLLTVLLRETNPHPAHSPSPAEPTASPVTTDRADDQTGPDRARQPSVVGR